MKNRKGSVAIVAAGLAVVLTAVLLRHSFAGTSRPRDGEAARSAGRTDSSESSVAASLDQVPKGNLRIVVLAGGKPVSGASVTLFHEDSKRQMDFTTQSDGSERILSIPSGNYHVGVCHPGFVFGAAEYRSEGGTTDEVTIHLQPGSRIEGRVVDGAGRPLEGAVVLLQEPNGGGPIAHDLTGRTDVSGQYVLEGVPAGTFDVRFRHDTHCSWIRPGLAVSARGETHHVDAVLERGSQVTGRVLSEAGEPIPGATVVGSNGETSTGRSREDGRFALQGLGGAPVHCFASAPGFGVAFQRGVPPGSAEVEFRLPRAASVSGRIDARPLPGRYTVQLFRFEPELARYCPLYSRAFEGTAGEDFRVPEISPGRYRLEVHADGYEAQNVPELSVDSGQSLSGLQVRLTKRP